MPSRWRVGVTATSHKVILNVLKEVVKARGGSGPGTIYKVGECEDEPLVESGAITVIESNQVAACVGSGVVGQPSQRSPTRHPTLSRTPGPAGPR